MNSSFYISDLKSLVRSFVPPRNSLSQKERWLAALGALLGLSLAAWTSYLIFGNTSSLPQLVAPMGASAVLIFAVPSSPLAQPWPALFGNCISAAVGLSCALLIGRSPAVAVLAVALAVLAMIATRSLHPPGGAIALLAVLGGAPIECLGWSFIWAPVTLQTTSLIVMAVAFHRMRKVSYPPTVKINENLHRTGDTQISTRLGITDADLDAVLLQHGKLLDISRSDLKSLITKTEIQAHRRRHGTVSCGDIMSRHLITVTFETDLKQCWQLLRTHKIKSIPVIDETRKVIGTISLIDFLKHAGLDIYHDFDLRLRHFLDGAQELTGSHAQVVGHIMNTSVSTCYVESDVLELVVLFTDLGLHSVPILNNQKQLQGIVTQSDLLSALYRMQIDRHIFHVQDPTKIR